MNEIKETTPAPQPHVMGSETAKAIALGASVLARIEDRAAREVAIRNALTEAARSPGPLLVESEDADWKDDPAQDERWNAGLDFGMMQLCEVLKVDPKSVTWDAATETLDGDVRAVLCNILRGHFGENWGPSSCAALSAPEEEG